jgi:hypothetical protein
MTTSPIESVTPPRQLFDHYFNNGSHIPTVVVGGDRKYSSTAEQHIIIICYAIIFPITLLCFALLLRFLRRHSIIGRRSEEELLGIFPYRNNNVMFGRTSSA